MGLLRYENPSPSNPCLSDACIKPCMTKSVACSVRQSVPTTGGNSGGYDAAAIGNERTFFVMTKLVPRDLSAHTEANLWRAPHTNSHCRCNGQNKADIPAHGQHTTIRRWPLRPRLQQGRFILVGDHSDCLLELIAPRDWLTSMLASVGTGVVRAGAEWDARRRG